jgi:hypothetical protein
MDLGIFTFTFASAAIFLAATSALAFVSGQILDVRQLVLQLLRRVDGERLEGVKDGPVTGAAADVAVDDLFDVGHCCVRVALHQAKLRTNKYDMT